MFEKTGEVDGGKYDRRTVSQWKLDVQATVILTKCRSRCMDAIEIWTPSPISRTPHVATTPVRPWRPSTLAQLSHFPFFFHQWRLWRPVRFVRRLRATIEIWRVTVTHVVEMWEMGGRAQEAPVRFLCSFCSRPVEDGRREELDQQDEDDNMVKKERYEQLFFFFEEVVRENHRGEVM